MWVLTGVVLGSIITSTHDTEEACRGRKAMLEKVSQVNQVECRNVNVMTFHTGSGGSSTTVLKIPGNGCYVTQKGTCE